MEQEGTFYRIIFSRYDVPCMESGRYRLLADAELEAQAHFNLKTKEEIQLKKPHSIIKTTEEVVRRFGDSIK